MIEYTNPNKADLAAKEAVTRVQAKPRKSVVHKPKPIEDFSWKTISYTPGYFNGPTTIGTALKIAGY